MRPTRDPAPDDIDLTALWRLAVRSLPKLVLWALLAGAATYGVLSLVAPRYMSEAQISIESVATNSPYADPSRAGQSDSASVRMDKEAVNTHVRALQSVDLAEKIVRDMKLGEMVEFNSALGRSRHAFGAAADRRHRPLPVPAKPSRSASSTPISVTSTSIRRKDSRVIGIRFSSSDPALAAAVANRIAETYRESLARQTIAETDDVQKALEPQITKLADEAAAAEAEVEKFRGEANIFKGGQQATGLNEQQLAELNAELSRVKAARSDAEARAKQEQREMLQAGSAEALGDVQKSPVIQALVQSRVPWSGQISSSSATLLPGHPRMRQLNADLAGLKTQINAEVAKIVDGPRQRGEGRRRCARTRCGKERRRDQARASSPQAPTKPAQKPSKPTPSRSAPSFDRLRVPVRGQQGPRRRQPHHSGRGADRLHGPSVERAGVPEEDRNQPARRRGRH